MFNHGSSFGIANRCVLAQRTGWLAVGKPQLYKRLVCELYAQAVSRYSHSACELYAQDVSRYPSFACGLCAQFPWLRLYKVVLVF